MTEEPVMPEAIWASLARAIVGSGSYELEGHPSLQIDRLTAWLQEGRKFGYDWEGEYLRIYSSWHSRRPRLPHPDQMKARVLAAGELAASLWSHAPNYEKHSSREHVDMTRRMADIVVYHNPDSMGFPATDVSEPDIVTNKPVSSASAGSRIWLLTGEGRPRRYFLRGVFVLSEIGAGDERGFRTRIRGTDAQFFTPMVELTHEEWFPDFKRSQGNFAFGFQRISDDRFIRALESLAASGHLRERTS